MTNEQLAALQEYVDEAIEALGLVGWRVKVLRDAESDGQASIEYFHGRLEAQLDVADDFFDRVPRSQRELVSHELAHLFFAHVDLHVGSREFHELLGEPAFQAFRAGWRQHLELAVDQLEQFLAPRLPLPQFPVTPPRPDGRHDWRECERG